MEPEAILINAVVLVILLILSAFFSMSETALTSASTIKIETIASEEGPRGKKAARALYIIKDNRAKMLSAILICNNLVNIFASSLATSLAIRIVGDVGVGVATGILTLLILIFGEITPKNYATNHAINISMHVSGVILALMTVLTPLIFILNKFVSCLLIFAKNNSEEDEEAITSEELKTVVNISREQGNIEKEEKDMIVNVFNFSDSAVKEVMTPRIDVTAVNIDWSYEKVMSVFNEDKYTRYPVYDMSSEHICGILNVKDILLCEDRNRFKIADHIREAYLTYETKKTSELFEEMRKAHTSMAVVLDEYGNMAGIITLEDLLEELVGEIRDEFDADEIDDIVPISKTEFDVSGSANLDDLSNELSLGFSSDDYDTIGGYLTGLFDHFPKVGETFVTEEGIILRTLKVSNNRVERIKISLPKVQE